MKNQVYKFGIGIFFLAMSIGVGRINSQTPAAENPPPIDSYQETQEKLCTEQPISVNRTYRFRILPRAPETNGAFGRKPWYFGVLKAIPFLENAPKDKYGIDDIRTLRTEFGRPAPVGESKRSKRIRLDVEQNLKEAEQQSEQKWLEWLALNPDAEIQERKKAEIRIRFQGLAAARLPKFDWREYNLDVGAVGFQGFNCNTCWAFAVVDAMQISRRLAAIRAQKNGFDDSGSPRPNARQLISCVVPETDYCKINWHGSALSFLVEKGLPLGGTSKYVGNKSGWVCDAETYVKALTWDFVSATPQKIAAADDIKRAVITYGPVVSMLNFDNCLWLYGGGVFNEEQKQDGTHIVLIIGWDDSKEAWLIKNSYGADWGESGFGWVKYGSNNIGQWSAWVMPDPKEEERIGAQFGQEKK